MYDTYVVLCVARVLACIRLVGIGASGDWTACVSPYMVTDVEPVESVGKGSTSVGTLEPEASDRTGNPGCILELECQVFYSTYTTRRRAQVLAVVNSEQVHPLWECGVHEQYFPTVWG